MIDRIRDHHIVCEAAGLDRASGLVACSDSDVDNPKQELRALEELFAPTEAVAR